MLPGLSFALAVCFVAQCLALQVTPNSKCASLCMEDPESDFANPRLSNTNYTEIPCLDNDFNDTPKGIKYKKCIQCLQTSTDASDSESDVEWYMYNVRYAVDVCLYSFPASEKTRSSPCDIDFACAPLKKALISGGLEPSNDTTYGYCSADGGSFLGPNLEPCVQCLQSSTDQVYTSNFLIALHAGCQQKPAAGELVGLSGSLFSEHAVNITLPPIDRSSGPEAVGMTTGAIVGIAVGSALLFVGGACLFIVYYRRNKAFYDNNTGPPEPLGHHPRGGSSSITPPMGGGFTPMGGGLGSSDHKQLSLQSDYELRAQQAYGNNAAYYDRIEKEMQMRHPHFTPDPHHPGSGPQGALPTHPAYVPRALSRTSMRNSGLQHPPPVKSNKPDSYALQTYLAAAEDALALNLPPPPPPRRSRDRISHSSSTSVHAIREAPPPPPPLSHSKVPSLSLPSVPRIRVPKKYLPPQINIQAATPVIGQSDPTAGPDISLPMSRNDSRFHEKGFGERRSPSPDYRSNAPLIQQQPPSRGPVQQQTVVDRRGVPYEEIALHTGKSTLYG